MPYSTELDVQRAAGGREKLKQLSDQEKTGQVDTGYVADAIADADSLLDSYLQHRFAIPLAGEDVTGIIRRMSAREAVFNLKQDRMAVTDLDQTQHEERVAWMEGVRRGEISPGLDPRPPESTSVAPATGNREDAPKHSLTRNKFEGWI